MLRNGRIWNWGLFSRAPKVEVGKWEASDGCGVMQTGMSAQHPLGAPLGFVRVVVTTSRASPTSRCCFLKRGQLQLDTRTDKAGATIAAEN